MVDLPRNLSLCIGMRSYLYTMFHIMYLDCHFLIIDKIKKNKIKKNLILRIKSLSVKAARAYFTIAHHTAPSPRFLSLAPIHSAAAARVRMEQSVKGAAYAVSSVILSDTSAFLDTIAPYRFKK